MGVGVSVLTKRLVVCNNAKWKNVAVCKLALDENLVALVRSFLNGRAKRLLSCVHPVLFPSLSEDYLWQARRMHQNTSCVRVNVSKDGFSDFVDKKRNTLPFHHLALTFPQGSKKQRLSQTLHRLDYTDVQSVSMFSSGAIGIITNDEMDYICDVFARSHERMYISMYSFELKADMNRQIQLRNPALRIEHLAFHRCTFERMVSFPLILHVLEMAAQISMHRDTEI